MQENRETLLSQAQAYMQERRWLHANEAFLALLERDEQDEEALLGVVTTLDTLGRYERLAQMAEALLRRNPNSAQGLAFKARALQKLERLSEATIANDQALLLDTNLPLAWINRSGLQLLQKKFPEALRSSQRAIELAPDDARAWANQGVALLNFGHMLEALAAFDKSLELDSSSLFSLQVKGEILLRLGRMTEVVKTAQQALHIDSSFIPTLIQLVRALRALESYNQLEDAAHLLTQLTPDDLFARENYMSSLRGQGKYEEANTSLDRVLELDTGNVRFWTLKADVLYRLERYREAANVAEQAVKIDADYAPARRIREKAVRSVYQKGKKR